MIVFNPDMVVNIVGKGKKSSILPFSHNVSNVLSVVVDKTPDCLVNSTQTFDDPDYGGF